MASRRRWRRLRSARPSPQEARIQNKLWGQSWFPSGERSPSLASCDGFGSDNGDVETHEVSNHPLEVRDTCLTAIPDLVPAPPPTPRTTWPEDAIPTFVHTFWRSEAGRGLADHPLYEPAKRQGNVEAALDVIEDLVVDENIDRLVDLWVNRGDVPVVVAPVSADPTAKNALALAYANWVAEDLGFEALPTLYQYRSRKRDMENGWHRFAHPSRIFGPLPAGRDFIIADDVCTLGGTLAETRAYIEGNGGKVIATTCLASPDGNHVQLGLREATLKGLRAKFGSDLDSFWMEEFGYDTSCLTEPEANYLLRNAGGVEQIRDGIYGARDRGDAGAD